MDPHLRGLLGAGLVGAAAATALFAAPWYYQPRQLTRALQLHWGDVLFEVETERRVFALTFDDGPHPPYTDAVLDTLAEYGAHATFFVMGEQVQRNPGTFQRLIDEGHEVANHFYDSHPSIMLSDEALLDSLDRTEEILGGHNSARLVRPASGLLRASALERLRERGYTVVLGSAYTSDPMNPPRAYIRWAFQQMLAPGRIAVLHDGRRNRQRTVDVLPAILEEARRADLEPVTVSDLVASGTALA